MEPHDIVRRCTRDGFTSWSAVAQQLGVSVDQARARHDPNYLRPNPFRQREIEKATIVDEFEASNDRKSPRVRTPLRIRVLATLPGTRQEVSMRIGITSNHAHSVLVSMKTEGLVTYDGIPRGRCLWSATEAGKTMLADKAAA